MSMIKSLVMAGVVAAALASATPASAVPIADGTVSSSHNFNPTVDVSSNPSTYAAMSGATFQTSGTGGFAGAQGKTGTLSGTIQFSQTAGVTITENLPNLFVFADGLGGNFTFSATSVLTRAFANNPGVTTSGSLYLLGTTVDSSVNFDPTLTSLTLSFNSTGGSAYSSSATLAVPPAPLQVPEPGTIALLGAGLVALGMVRRKAV